MACAAPNSPGCHSLDGSKLANVARLSWRFDPDPLLGNVLQVRIWPRNSRWNRRMRSSCRAAAAVRGEVAPSPSQRVRAHILFQSDNWLFNPNDELHGSNISIAFGKYIPLLKAQACHSRFAIRIQSRRTKCSSSRDCGDVIEGNSDSSSTIPDKRRPMDLSKRELLGAIAAAGAGLFESGVRKVKDSSWKEPAASLRGD